MSSKRFAKPDKVGELLSGATKGLNIMRRIKDYQAVDQWPHIVGEAIASHSQAQKILGDTLYVKVDHPVWLTELKMMEPMLVAKLKEHLPNTPISKLKLIN